MTITEIKETGTTIISEVIIMFNIKYEARDKAHKSAHFCGQWIYYLVKLRIKT